MSGFWRWEPDHAIPDRRFQVRAVALLVVACRAAVFVIGVGWLTLELGTDGLACHRANSVYGKEGWSFVPPGPDCTWTVEANGVEAYRGPSAVTSTWLVTLVVGGLAAGILVRAARFGRREIESAGRITGVGLAGLGLVLIVVMTIFGSGLLLGPAVAFLVVGYVVWVRSTPIRTRANDR